MENISGVPRFAHTFEEGKQEIIQKLKLNFIVHKNFYYILHVDICNY